MKKVLFLMAMLLPILFTSCSNDDEDDVKTTYTLQFDYQDMPSSMDMDIWLFEYNENDEIVNNNIVSDIQHGYIEKFEAKENAVKVKAQVRMEIGSKESSTWVQQVFYLTKNNNTDIKIGGKTITGKYEP